MADLLKILDEKGVSIANFAKQSGVNAERVHSWKAGRGNPKAEDSALIQNWLKKYYETNGNVEEIPTIQQQPIIKENQSEIHRLLSITEKITDSHLGLVRSHESLTQDHHKIILQNEELTKNITAHDQKEIDLIVARKIEAVIERLANQCIGQHWNTREEALKSMGIALAGKHQSNLQ